MIVKNDIYNKFSKCLHIQQIDTLRSSLPNGGKQCHRCDPHYHLLGNDSLGTL